MNRLAVMLTTWRRRWRRVRDRNALVAGALIALVWLGVLIGTERGIGYMKDEGYYFSAAASNISWYPHVTNRVLGGDFAAVVDRPTIDRYWENNNEHPPLLKVAMGINLYLWHAATGLMNPGRAFRMSTMLMSAAVVGMMFVFLWRRFGTPTALFGVAALTAMPHFYFHSHLNTFDVPLVFVWIVTIDRFVKGFTNPKDAVIAAVLWGLAFACRNAALFIPAGVAFLFFYAPHGRELLRNLPREIASLARVKWWVWAVAAVAVAGPATLAGMYGVRDGSPFNRALFTAWVLLALYTGRTFWVHGARIAPWWYPIVPPMVISPIVFVLAWPWLWHDVWNRLGVFLNRHANPPAWQTVYLDRIIEGAPPYPWHYPFVMWFWTIPAVLLVLGTGAFVLALARGRLVRAVRAWFAAPAADPYEHLKGRTIEALAREAQTRSRAERIASVDEFRRHIKDLARDRDFAFAWMAVNLVLPVLLIALPTTPKYGSVKHYLTGMVFLCAFAGVGFGELYRRLPGLLPAITNPRRLRVAGTIVALLLLWPGWFGVVAQHNSALGYYNEFMGSVIRAPEVGVQESFWAYQWRPLADTLNRVVPPGGAVSFNNVPHDSFRMTQLTGILRRDIRLGGSPESSDVHVVNLWKMYRDGMHEVEEKYGTIRPLDTFRVFGLPFAVAYKNPKRP